MLNTTKPFLLIASPELRDPNFARSVVLVTRHDDEGSFGWVLNRPLGQCLGDVVGSDALDGRVREVPLFRGGPVEPQAAQFLTNMAGGELMPTPLEGVSILPIESATTPADLSPLFDQLGDGALVRGYLGYAGWGQHQLDGEFDEGSWLVAEAAHRHVFDIPAEDLWASVLWEQGGESRWIVLDDVDPNLN